MKVEMKPVVDCMELEEAVKLQFGLDDTFDLGRSCFELAENDSYQSFCVDQEALDDTENEIKYYESTSYQWELEMARQKLMVQTFLHDLFPEEDVVIVRYYW